MEMSTLSSPPLYSDAKIICNKEDVVLLKDERRENGSNNSYRIIFNVHNPNFPIHSIIGLKLYTLLYELNRDVIHTFKVVNETETSVETVTLFKPFGKDFGIAPKAMHTVSTIQRIESGAACTFDSVDVRDGGEVNINHIHIPKKYERIQSTHSKLIVYFLSANDLQFDFTFELSDDSSEDEEGETSRRGPIYMENSVALMIKKMFCRLKVFTERMA